MDKTKIAILLTVLTLGSCLTLAQDLRTQLFTVVPAKSNVPNSAANYFDVFAGKTSPEKGLIFNVEDGAGSPPNGQLFYVGVFNTDLRISGVAVLKLKGLDSSGMALELSRATLGSNEVATYERMIAATTSQQLSSTAELPLLRHMSILGIFGEKSPPLSREFHSKTEQFRLPVPPLNWPLETERGTLMFRITMAGTTTVRATLIENQ